MMTYQKYPSTSRLKNWVHCFFVWEGSELGQTTVESPPSGHGAIVVNFGAPYRVTNAKFRNKKTPASFIAGQALSNYAIHLRDNVGTVGAVLYPTALYDLFGLNMPELSDRRRCLCEIEPETAPCLVSKIVEASSNRKRVDLLQKYLEGFLKNGRRTQTDIALAVDRIYEAKGKINVNDVIADLPISRRHFERKFSETVGVSPKMYARLRRFGHTCLQMAGNRKVNLMDTLFEGGYYDQSHFIKDFKYFSDRTPRRYALTNKELSHFVSPIAMVEARLQQG